MDIKVLGIDLAKNVFQLHGTNLQGKCLMRKTLRRTEMANFLANMKPCIVGMEACGGAHYWARLCKKYGHEVRLMAPGFVKPYVKSNKTDRNDAEAIAEACMRPSMRFVAVKTEHQQNMLAIHRARELAMKQRSALSNQLRGLLAEYGIVLQKGNSVTRKLAGLLEGWKDLLSPMVIELFTELHESFAQADDRIKKFDARIERLVRQDEKCMEIQKIPGIGPVAASAVVATVGDAGVFRNGREMAAWLGLVPRQNSSGGKVVMGGISKRGDCYARKQIIQGARAFIRVCEQRADRIGCWAASKKLSGGFNKASVAMANKNARMIWAVMQSGSYCPAE